jgi:hypothetical protein
MDPEDLREVISAYQTACVKVIQTYDGLLAKFMGDGIIPELTRMIPNARSESDSTSSVWWAD